MKNWVSFLLFLGLWSPAFSAEFVVPEKGSNAFCRVNTMGEHTTMGGRCYYFDEVMTGISQIDPLIIRCARLQVDCNRNNAEALANEDEAK